ncbi:MAG: transglycosylase SLT domain-containing protein [Deltaproteobacteria bacterium]
MSIRKNASGSTTPPDAGGRPLAAPGRGIRHATLLGACAALLGLTCDAQANLPEARTGSTEEAPVHAAAEVAVEMPSEAVLALRRDALIEGAPSVMAHADVLAQGAGGDEAALFAWVAASLDPNEASARARFERIASGASALAPWARIETAQRFVADDPERARALLAPLLSASPEADVSALGAGWPGLAEARAMDALAGAALATAATREEAERDLRAAMRGPLPASTDRALARALADLLATSGEAPAKREAIGLYLDLLSAAPRGRAAVGADAALDAIVSSFPEDERALLRRPSLAQSRLRAANLEATQQHRAASDAYAEIAGQLEAGSAARCSALLDAGRALHRGRVNEAAVERLEAMIAECRPALDRAQSEHGEDGAALEARRDALAWAHYAAGRAALSSGRAPLSILHLEAVGDAAPEHRLLDDALVFAARARLERGERERAHEALLRAISVAGDMRGEARFQRAWDLRASGDREGALAELEHSLDEGTGEAAEGMLGRAAYWRARVLAELGRRDEALDALETVVRERPLTYYAQLALARLGELDAVRQRATRAELLSRRAPLGTGSVADLSRLARLDAAREISTRLHSDAERATYARAGALLTVGELGRAETELAPLGLSADGDLASVRVLVALLMQAGHPHRATELSRRRLAAALVAPADAEAIALFRTAYPPAFAGLIEDAAGAEDVDPSLVRAVAREESSFDPDAVSVAHAYGLLQLIRSTAQRHARPLGLPSDPAALCTPSVNIRIGARYMGALRRRYDGLAAFIPAAYNAGEGNVDRWLRERSARPFDEWVEEIPYGETRGYTRRVLQSWIVYAFLDRGEFPELPATLPRRE